MSKPIKYGLNKSPVDLDISYSDKNINYQGSKMYSFKFKWLYEHASEAMKKIFDENNSIMQDYANKRDTFEYLGTITYKGDISELYANGDEIIIYFTEEEDGEFYLPMIVVAHRKGLAQ